MTHSVHAARRLEDWFELRRATTRSRKARGRHRRRHRDAPDTGLGAAQRLGAHGNRGHQGPDRDQDHRRDQAATTAAGKPAAAAKFAPPPPSFVPPPEVVVNPPPTPAPTITTTADRTAAGAGGDRAGAARSPTRAAARAARRRGGQSPSDRRLPGPRTTRRGRDQGRGHRHHGIRFTIDATGKLASAEVVKSAGASRAHKAPRPRRPCRSSANASSGPATTRTAARSAARVEVEYVWKLS